jgi:hypothetical protein
MHQLLAQVAVRELSGQCSVKIKRAGRRLEVHDVAAAKAGNICCGNGTAGREVCPAASRRNRVTDAPSQ